MNAHPHAASLTARMAEVARHNATALRAVAGLVLDCVRADGLVLTAGSGHSLGAVAETFYRAGGLACVRPLYHPELLPLNGARSSTSAERRPGLADEVLAATPLGRDDVLVVFSNSGINPYPVELAARVRAAGRPVVAVTSTAASAAAPRRAQGTLAGQASVVLDTLVPQGDAGYPKWRPVTAAESTLSAAMLWNLLLAELLDTTDVELPLWRSSNVAGGDEANAALLERYSARIPELL